jgi:hypothetical protein
MWFGEVWQKSATSPITGERETITNRGLMRPGAEKGPYDAPVFPARCRILLRFPLADRLPIGASPGYYLPLCQRSGATPRRC